jgi:nucleoside-triphosphatase
LKVILLTGVPGVGKTTIVSRLCANCSAKGITVHGVTTREMRENGQRVGFKITDVATGAEGWLARKDLPDGPRVGSYRVVTANLEQIGVAALDRAMEGHASIVVVDEIGPMEMTSVSFRNAVSRIFDKEEPVVATVKLGSHYPEVDKIRGQSKQLEITKDNRENLYRELIEQVDKWTVETS